jgi:arylsulfatase A-like enzyme
VPALLKQAGYYTCIGGPLVAGTKRQGKTDYNFEWDESIYDGNDWSGRAAGQPFFMQVQLHGGKYRGGNKWEAEFAKVFGAGVKPTDVTLPPYYPRDPVLLADWASYLDTCRYTDYEVGQVISRLEREGILDNTLVIFLTDHGISHARGKQFLYDEGTHVPLVIRGPNVARGKMRDDLVEHIDVAAITLAAAGLPLPTSLQARNVLAADYQPRDAVFAARDRCDETVEHLRSVRTDRWLYIRNYLNQRPHLQPNNYKDGKEIVKRLRQLHEEHQLDALTESLLFAPTRPAEELYEWQVDPYEVRNLAGESQYADVLNNLRTRLSRWEQTTGDQGVKPESDAMYTSDMAEYLGGGRKQAAAQKRLQANIDLMRRWASEGK